jgi:uncharacterized protein
MSSTNEDSGRAPFHRGELAVQERAGVTELAQKIGRNIQTSLPAPAIDLLREQRLAVLAGRDAAGRIWTSALTGEPGFIQALDPGRLAIQAELAAGDPLAASLSGGTVAGLLVINPATLRRIRINGKAERGPDGGVLLRIAEAFGNCQKYIQVRTVSASVAPRQGETSVRRASVLDAAQRAWIARADTFFIGSANPEGGADASHRGGNPGFVQVLDERHLAWPDYAGNNMFQTLGNLQLDPRAGLLFVEFERGDTLQLTGRAEVIWEPARLLDYPGAQRLVELSVDEVVQIGAASTLRWELREYSPYNPA